VILFGFIMISDFGINMLACFNGILNQVLAQLWIP
jgi:hypothetical protein